ncbi:hypothetical protein HN587_04390 [Candidatus Woesearchaeota archaeon]|jgi:hypothetical protein|nr:hypothetical protein [Candidatus Woesearchaeota archaeon]
MAKSVKLEKILSKVSNSWDDSRDIVVVSGISFIFGFSMGLVGKLTGEHWIPIIPPAMDSIWGVPSPYTIPYGVGAAINYLPEISASLTVFQSYL